MLMMMRVLISSYLGVLLLHHPVAAAVRGEHKPRDERRALQKDPNLVKAPSAIAKTSKVPTIKATKAPTIKATKAPTIKVTKAPAATAAVKNTKVPTPPKATVTQAPIATIRGQATPSTLAPVSSSAMAPVFAPTPTPSCPSCPAGGDIVIIVFVPAPTSDPTTSRPTRSPTNKPTRAPTRRPTQRPTRSPTNKPTRAPTRRPTQGPTRSPTNSPTRSPTHHPTHAPTTASPTLSPTFYPTHAPVIGPSTPWPTVTPTTRTPTRTPSQQPSVSFQPSTSPLPSSAPTPVYTYDIVVLSEQQVQLYLYVSSSEQRSRRFLQAEATEPMATAGKIDSDCTTSSTVAGAQKIQDDIRENVATLVQHYETLDVLVYNWSTSSVVLEQQQQQEVIVLQMDIMIRIRSSVQIDPQVDKELFIKGPWDTPTERLAFATWLRQHGGASGCFDHVADTSPLLLSQQEAASENDDASTMMVAVAAVLGVLAFCCFAVCGIVGYRRSTSTTLPPPKQMESPKDSQVKDDAFLEIACDVATNEISTLGDPIGPYHAVPLMGVSTVGSTSLDYDYQVAFGKLEPAAQDEDDFTGIGASTTTMSQREDIPVESLKHLLDPAMLERLMYDELLFRVTAPKGPLGLFLRSHPIDGRPMVVHVKQTSCLAACIQPGDSLLVVNDDIVVTQYSPSRVSQLLVSLMRQRVEEDDSRSSGIALAFSRPRK